METKLWRKKTGLPQQATKIGEPHWDWQQTPQQVAYQSPLQ